MAITSQTFIFYLIGFAALQGLLPYLIYAYQVAQYYIFMPRPNKKVTFTAAPPPKNVPEHLTKRQI